ncbi:hypothetical protein [Pseudobacter ginsenosidimutans]|uniref:Uncharacterized protein n=1 Tax=Pseudobacter ginsenosidimutans TaxID=661488 RepID=A0A4Q7MQX2_9BACT|nr:hypothetical protein [Pseudobacter ginsenosidimutans]QEC42210.1 hypothetical protein FSB84_11100 [Pseudobacter ginsenosidimutans]RZS70947.1 hypothetical protein EV199_2846 [Pseudobacter ginsenosidimutans]
MNAGYKGRYAGKGWIIYHPDDPAVDLSEHITDTAILNNNSQYYPYLDNIPFDSTSNLLSESDNLNKYCLPVFNWGWHNIDKLMEDILGAEIIDVSLTVPGYKAFIIATTTDSTKLYAGISEFVLNSKHDLTIKVKPSSVKATEKLLEKISEGIPKNTFVELSNNELDSASAPNDITSSPDSNNKSNRGSEKMGHWFLQIER